MEEVASHNKVDDCWLVIGNDATGKYEYSVFKSAVALVVSFFYSFVVLVHVCAFVHSLSIIMLCYH
jgi:hypothetical protein